MTQVRQTLATILLALAGLLSPPPAAPAIDAEPARCAAAVAVAYSALAGDAPAPVPPPAPPAPPAPESPCGGKCSGGTFRPDGRIPMQCPSDCPCGCRRANSPGKPDSSPKCKVCLDNKHIMGADGVIRQCRSCCPDGKCPLR
jgi:hypothetical protein